MHTCRRCGVGSLCHGLVLDELCVTRGLLGRLHGDERVLLNVELAEGQLLEQMALVVVARQVLYINNILVHKYKYLRELQTANLVDFALKLQLCGEQSGEKLESRFGRVHLDERLVIHLPSVFVDPLVTLIYTTLLDSGA